MLHPQLDVSVVIATRDRAALLQQTLEGLQKQKTGSLSWEVVIIDNGSSDDTQSVLKRPWEGLTLVKLVEDVAGKSRALNQALERVRGTLLVFTDDDVLPVPVWLSSLYAAFIKYPSAQVFCGPITPAFPPETPYWLRSHPYLYRMFGALEPGLPEGPLPKPWMPFGANYAIRASAVEHERFRLDLGPSLENGPMFQEDTEFIGRFSKTAGNVIFSPSARIIHQIPVWRTKLEYLCERSFFYGRAQVIATGQPAFIHNEIIQNRKQPPAGDIVRYEHGTLINYYCGQQYQLELMGVTQFNSIFRRAFEELQIHSNQDLLIHAARTYLQTNA